MLALPPPAHLPCERCGASVPRDAAAEHVCDEERRLDYELFRLRDGIARLPDDLAAWLETPQGRFALYLAERG